jgi:hypothetical protein
VTYSVIYYRVRDTEGSASMHVYFSLKKINFEVENCELFMIAAMSILSKMFTLVNFDSCRFLNNRTWIPN